MAKKHQYIDEPSFYNIFTNIKHEQIYISVFISPSHENINGVIDNSEGVTDINRTKKNIGIEEKNRSHGNEKKKKCDPRIK